MAPVALKRHSSPGGHEPLPRGCYALKRDVIDALYDPPARPVAPAVENLDDCISINHNWINGHGVHWTWALLRGERAAAAEGIDDCRALCK